MPKNNKNSNESSSTSKNDDHRVLTSKDPDEVCEMANQLMKLDLEIREIKPDGNCMFSAISDQLVGTSDKAGELRRNTCMYIVKNKDHFFPFIGESDDEFTHFLQLLNRDGVFGGQEALVAISREHNVMIGIHQLDSPVWYIKPEDERKCKKEIHLAYHQKTMHYSSIRRKGDVNKAGSGIKLQGCQSELKSGNGVGSENKTVSSAPTATNSRKNRRKNKRKPAPKVVVPVRTEKSEEVDKMKTKISI